MCVCATYKPVAHWRLKKDHEYPRTRVTDGYELSHAY